MLAGLGGGSPVLGGQSPVLGGEGPVLGGGRGLEIFTGCTLAFCSSCFCCELSQSE